jgi:hypothetical protein
MAWSIQMAKSPRSESNENAPRRGGARPCGELVGAIAGTSFKRFGFVQGAVVSRWPEIVANAMRKPPPRIDPPPGKSGRHALPWR